MTDQQWLAKVFQALDEGVVWKLRVLADVLPESETLTEAELDDRMAYEAACRSGIPQN